MKGSTSTVDNVEETLASVDGFVRGYRTGVSVVRKERFMNIKMLK